jgi:lipopolysaccharide transport system ATP-binding protein
VTLAHIDFRNVSIEFPIFNATGRSLSSSILKIATGGKLDADPNGRVLVRALTDISFSLRDGDRVAILGHNGAGKSTLLRALGGIYTPSTGQADVVGEVGSLIDISLGINPEATGRENVFIRGQLLGFTKQEISEKYNEIVDFAELGDFMEMPVRTYSSGMHLRLAFAVSTVVRPEILLMDEWLSVGDAGFRQKAEHRLRNLVSETKILVIATHSRDLVETVCNRAIWLEHGKVKMDDKTSDVLPKYFD